MTKENKDLKVDRIGNYLEGKEIALGVTGGIAAIKTPEIARHLRRLGAEVTAYMTPESQKFIGKAALEWATEKEVVDGLSGLAEHIVTQDLVLVAPATTNTVNKIMSGIADNPVTTLVASALGEKVPTFLAPTMHESLYKNPFYQENIKQISRYGIHELPARISEGKAKMPRTSEMGARISHFLTEDKLKHKKILITGGPTPGKIDDVRAITNRFKGTLAVKMAREMYHRGADVKLLLGKTGIPVPNYIDTKYHEDYFEYFDNVMDELNKEYDAGVFSAAVADYVPSNPTAGKINSRGGLESIALKETEKVIEVVRESHPELVMATFKYVLGKTYEELVNIAQERTTKDGYELVVANRGENMKDSHRATIVNKHGIIATPRNSQEIATTLSKKLGNYFT